MFRSVLALNPEEITQSTYVCTGRIAPDYENRELNVGEGAIRVAVLEATGVDRNSLREKYRKFGDIGDVA